MPLLRERRARRRTVAIAAALAVAALVVVANLRLFVWPAVDTVERADAVVVLGGGDGERLDRGLALVREGVASTLALSFGPDQLCNVPQSFDVVCFTPTPENTRGEAMAVGQLARTHGWQRVVLVTSTPHVTRARLLVERCFAGDLEVAPATPDDSTSRWVNAILHEWGGLADAMINRSC